MRRKRWLLVLLAFFVILFIVYLAGPAPATPVYNDTLPSVPAAPADLEHYISAEESLHKLKTDNQARVVWFDDSTKSPTEYALVYLHGFSASQGEGDSIHRWMARTYGCNLYLARLAEHGIDTVDAMINLTPDNYWESAKEALAIGSRLGKKIILVGTSTGGSFALQLAATYPDRVAALVLMSPNIAINDGTAWILNNHWGLQVARKVVGTDYIISKDEYGPLYDQYWYKKYRLEAVVALQEYLETQMIPSTFAKVHQPVGLFYYYKDETHQDSTVKVSAELSMFSALGTPDSLKMKEAIPESGTHVIGSSIRSHDIAGVRKGIDSFMTGVLHVKPYICPACPGK